MLLSELRQVAVDLRLRLLTSGNLFVLGRLELLVVGNGLLLRLLLLGQVRFEFFLHLLKDTEDLTARRRVGVDWDREEGCPSAGRSSFHLAQEVLQQGQL